MFGAIIGGAFDYLGSQKQAEEMEDAARRDRLLQREQFEYAKDLQEGLMAQREPRRESSQRAMRSLSMLLGLGDPGGTASFAQEQELEELKQQRAEEEKYKTTYDLSDFEKVMTGPESRGGEEVFVRKDQVGETTQGTKIVPGGVETYTLDQILSGVEPSDEINPEWTRLNEEINQIESEIAQVEEGEDGFEGPRDVTEMPGYQFMRDQGLQALASSGAARGMQLSGRQLEESQRFGQGLASQYRGQLIDELGMMAGMRPSGAAANNLSSLAMQYGQQAGQNALMQGSIGAAEAGGTYGALGSAFGNTDWSKLMDMFGGGNNTQGSSPYSGMNTSDWPNSSYGYGTGSSPAMASGGSSFGGSGPVGSGVM